MNSIKLMMKNHQNLEIHITDIKFVKIILIAISKYFVQLILDYSVIRNIIFVVPLFLIPLGNVFRLYFLQHRRRRKD